jgi:hypothetical protein
MNTPIGGMTVGQLTAFTGSRDQLNDLINWKAGSFGVLRHYRMHTITRGDYKMQRQFTIELRVDFADADKLPELKKTLQQCARHAFATAQLLSDTPKTTAIAVFSDDFFSGNEEIKLMEDVIQQGLDDVNETSGAEKLSSELVEAMNGR